MFCQFDNCFVKSYCEAMKYKYIWMVVFVMSLVILAGSMLYISLISRKPVIKSQLNTVTTELRNVDPNPAINKPMIPVPQIDQKIPQNIQSIKKEEPKVITPEPQPDFQRGTYKDQKDAYKI